MWFARSDEECLQRVLLWSSLCWRRLEDQVNSVQRVWQCFHFLSLYNHKYRDDFSSSSHSLLLIRSVTLLSSSGSEWRSVYKVPESPAGPSGPAHQNPVAVLQRIKLQRLQIVVDLNLSTGNLQDRRHKNNTTNQHLQTHWQHLWG